MKNILLIALLNIFTLSALGQKCGKAQPIKEVVNEALSFATQQSLLMAKSLADSPILLPKTTDRFGRLETCQSGWWVSGFFPGVLWYLYENNPSEDLKKWAENYTLRVQDQQFTTDNHDVGFMIFCSFGNGYRITHNPDYLNVIHNATNSLITRFRPSTGCIRSWDRAEWNKQWQYPVIIDNMMNLELLLWSGSQFDEEKYADVAISHANTTKQNQYRPDFSCYHVVSYDTISGQPELKQTAQGYNHNSAWARGRGGDCMAIP